MKNDNASNRDHPSLEDCQAAEKKLHRLFKSFGADALEARDRLIDPYLDRAVEFSRQHTGFDLGSLAVEEAEADLEAWFVALLGDHLEDRSAAVMIGRAAFLMCGGPSQWTDQLLRPVDSLPEAFVADLRDHVPSVVPPSDIGEMHHQAYEAWSPASMVMRALPVERGLFQGLAGLIRRDDRAAVLSWRNGGPTP